MACDATTRRLCNLADCSDCFNKSFASHPKAVHWSDQNQLSPRDMFKSSGKKAWFKCDKCPHVFNGQLDNISKGQWCPYCLGKKLCEDASCQMCYENSFASHFRSECWSSRNKLSPRDIRKYTHDKYWFDCPDCFHEFEISIASVTDGDHWCSYCADQKLCDNSTCSLCFNKSFASHPKAVYWSNRNLLTPRQVFKSSSHKYIFTCMTCQHYFSISLSKIVTGNWCTFCSNKELCANEFCSACYDKSFEAHHRSSNWDFEKNYPTTPRDIFRSTAKPYWFICDNGHSFSNSPNAITNNSLQVWCSQCRHKTQDKLSKWLKGQYPLYTIISEAKFKWCVWAVSKRYCPFDFYIPELNLLIELDGSQHFRQVANWTSVEETQEKDIFKMLQALNQNISMIRLEQEDVLYDRTPWIQQLIEVIKKYETPQIIYLGERYTQHQSTVDLLRTLV